MRWYIDDNSVFNCDNFEDISLSIYPKELVLKNNNSTNFSSFLDFKINFATNYWLINVYDKRLDFNFKVNTWLTGILALAKKFWKISYFRNLLKLREFAIIPIV